MSTPTDDEGMIIAILDRFRLQRLPRALELLERVKGGAKLEDRDIDFLEQVFADGRDVQSLGIGERHPELQKLAAQVASIYKEITETALANEQKG